MLRLSCSPAFQTPLGRLQIFLWLRTFLPKSQTTRPCLGPTQGSSFSGLQLWTPMCSQGLLDSAAPLRSAQHPHRGVHEGCQGQSVEEGWDCFHKASMRFTCRPKDCKPVLFVFPGWVLLRAAHPGNVCSPGPGGWLPGGGLGEDHPRFSGQGSLLSCPGQFGRS